MLKKAILTAITFSLSACSSSQVVVGSIVESPHSPQHGLMEFNFAGKVTHRSDNNTLNIAIEGYSPPGYARLTCTGFFKSNVGKKNVEFPIVCTQARHGTALIKFDKGTNLSGEGSFYLSDGSYGIIYFGDAIKRDVSIG